MKHIILILSVLSLKSLAQNNIDFSAHNVQLDFRVILNDFVLQEYTDDYWYVFVRLTNVSSTHLQYVNIKYNIYNQGTLVKHEYDYIDYDTYEDTGLIPNSSGLISSLLEKIEFDSISFDIEYSTDIGNMLSINTEALQIISSSFNDLSYSDLYDEWVGEIKNESNTPIQYPQIYACFFKEGKLIRIENSYIDVQDNTIQPQMNGQFDDLVILPVDYDDVIYYLHYSIGLTGPVQMPTLVNDCKNKPRFFKLSQNYPNPFNSSTTIRFRLPKSSFVTLKIYDCLGKEIGTILNGWRKVGVYEINWSAKGLPSGIYFCRFQDDQFVKTRKLILQK